MKKQNLTIKLIPMFILGIALSLSSIETFATNTHANPDNNGWGKASDNGDFHASPTGNSNGVGHQQPVQRPKPIHGKNNVGAPLDGGILTLILGGIGAAYAVRKGKKQSKN